MLNLFFCFLCVCRSGCCWGAPLWWWNLWGGTPRQTTVQKQKQQQQKRVLFCPIYVTQSHFIQSFPAILRRVTELSNITVVSATKVPVVKFKTSSAAVDVVFVSCALTAPPTEEQLLQHSFFQVVAKETRQSVQGIRTVLEIRRRLPVSFDTFTFTLKAVKYWAMQRKVYGNVFGFPPGVALAVMVARICQVYPAAHPSVLLRFFFRFYTQWFSKLNAISPLYITEVLKPDLSRVVGLFESWDPQRESSKEELLPVLNPAFPHANTCYNVGRGGIQAFYAELSRANQILHRGITPVSVFTDWAALWSEFKISEHYNLLLEISVALPRSATAAADDALAPKSAAQQFDEWCAYIESRLRILFYGLESLFDARVVPQRYSTTPKDPRHGRQSKWYIAIKRRDQANGTVSPHPVQLQELAESIEDFRFTVLDLGLRGPYGFQRNPTKMLEPFLRLVSIEDDSVPKDLRAAKRARQ